MLLWVGRRYVSWSSLGGGANERRFLLFFCEGRLQPRPITATTVNTTRHTASPTESDNNGDQSGQGTTSPFVSGYHTHHNQPTPHKKNRRMCKSIAKNLPGDVPLHARHRNRRCYGRGRLRFPRVLHQKRHRRPGEGGRGSSAGEYIGLDQTRLYTHRPDFRLG